MPDSLIFMISHDIITFTIVICMLKAVWFSHTKINSAERRSEMKNVERFNAVMNFEKPDRLPVIEWAGWWGDTLNRW